MKLGLVIVALYMALYAFSGVSTANAACFRAGGGECEPRKARWAGEGYAHRFYPGPYGDHCFVLVNVDLGDGEEGYTVGPFEVDC